MKPSVRVIVLNWNGKNLTLRCLESLIQVKYNNFATLVVDNGSTDGSTKAIKDSYPKCNVLELPQNLGYAGGNNAGVQYLKNNPSDYIIFLNNDTIVDPQFIDQLMSGVEEFGDEYIYGPKIFYLDHPDLIWYAGGDVNLNLGRVKHRGIRKPDSERYNKCQRTDFITGCCIMLSFKMCLKLNGFDESYKMYSEDVDLCLRAEQLDIHSYIIPSSQIWHEVSASLGGQWNLMKNLKKLRSQFQLIHVHGELYLKWVAYFFLMLELPKQVIMSALAFKKMRK